VDGGDASATAAAAPKHKPTRRKRGKRGAGRGAKGDTSAAADSPDGDAALDGGDDANDNDM